MTVCSPVRFIDEVNTDSLDMQSPASPRGPQSESTRRKKALQRIFERWDLDKSGLLEAAALRDRGACRPDHSAMIGRCGNRAARSGLDGRPTKFRGLLGVANDTTSIQ